MRRRALFFCLACVFSAVSTNPASAAFETVRRVGVISALGDTFAVQKVGITVFGNDQKEFAIDSWKIDDFVIGKVRAALGKRFDVRPVTYQKAAFLAPPPNIFTSANTAVANAVRAHASPQGLDAYVVVTKGGSALGQSNQSVRGLGIVDGSGLVVTNVHIFALYWITVVDGRQFTVLASSAGPNPGFLVSIHGPSREVDKSWWPTALDAAHNPKLKSAIVELLGQALPQTLQKLELVK